MIVEEVLKFTGYTLNRTAKLCLTLYGHQKLTVLTVEQLREIKNHRTTSSVLDYMMKKTEMSPSGLRSRCDMLFGHNSFKKLTDEEIEKVINYKRIASDNMIREKSQITQLMDIAGRGRMTINLLSKKAGVKLKAGTATKYTKEQFEAVIKLSEKGNITKDVKTIKENKKYYEIENFIKFDENVLTDDFLNNLSWFFDIKYQLLKAINDDFSYITYKKYKEHFEKLYKLSLETLKDDCIVKKTIIDILDIENIEYKVHEKQHYYPISRFVMKSRNYDTFENVYQIARHMLNTIGQLNDVLKNFDKWPVVQSNFYTLYSAKLNIPTQKTYRQHFRKHNNIKHDLALKLRKRGKK